MHESSDLPAERERCVGDELRPVALVRPEEQARAGAGVDEKGIPFEAIPGNNVVALVCFIGFAVATGRAS